MTPQEFIDSQKGVTRRHLHDGKVYVIRDVWTLDASKPSGYRLVTCQYATKKNGVKTWVNCPEGVMFSEIEPFEAAA
ncbi:hypothetical protein ELI01_18765 [Rhizobium leguminosarum]|uniref:hypothetical protein n=1 Tax=Rhizobium leguminosarum TaxID=384 RepID=UPI0010313436|nr:hypothetical protein [Rhizobium leguminosarum]TAX57122.1 hypothetical protein ELI01_18765 [Rhizobium leguminosarum]